MAAHKRRSFLALLGASVAMGLTSACQAAPAAKAKTFPIAKSNAEWRKQLTPAQYRILREAGTERPGSSPLDREKRKGNFVCAADKSVLFSSVAKFDSGTGWPSFWKPQPGAVVTHKGPIYDPRVEVLCAQCGGHLGHVFNDGPKPTGLRYCMNGDAMLFVSAKA